MIGSAVAGAAARVMADAHEALLDDGGDQSFWENGWLEDRITYWRSVAAGG